MQGTLCALLIAATTLAAHSTSPSDWAGVWQGELDGQPSVVLALAQDNGALEGTLVLNGINDNGGQPHIAVHEAHVLMHPTLSGNSLSFAVKGLRGSSTTMNFTLEQTSGTDAKMHCLTCGEDAPVVQLAKQD
jgi:hypothetical protein